MQRGFDSLLKGTCDWADASGRPSGRKNTIPPAVPTAVDRSESPLGCLPPSLELGPQSSWPGLGVVRGFVIGIGMAGPGFGVLAREAFVTSGSKVTAARFISPTATILLMLFKHTTTHLALCLL